MRFIFFSIFILLFLSSGFAQQQREHFRGGMLLHTGYLSNDAGQTEINGICTGIGGKIVFPVSEHIRVGTEGYVSNYNYKNNNGFFKLGWGGILAEYQYKIKKITPVLGVAFGGGKVRDLFPIAGEYTDNIPDIAVYKVYGTMVIAPQASLEYSLSSHVNVVAKVDYLFYPGLEYSTSIANGPRLFVGFLFSR